MIGGLTLRRLRPLRKRTPALESLEDRRMLYDSSAPAILQWFESSYDTIEQRLPDLFQSGYGAVWMPPPGRADISDFSVGYDQYDRFDLGSSGRPTLYGTETGIKTLANGLHRAGLDYHVDFVLNHNGYSGTNDHADREAFKAAGGYPGFFQEFFGDVDGDFNSAYSYGDVQGRLAGLIDINHSKNYRAVRNPVPGVADNVAAGTVPHNGRLANVPDDNNRRFYPDIGHNTIFVFDPITGEQNIPVHQFNLGSPLSGDPTKENATGYLMRYAQWLVQVIGIDGLRIDAAKHVDGFVLDFLDRAVYRQNPRNLLDGSPKHVFSYSEVYDANPATLLPHVKKNINPFDPGRIGGNRDTLDFKLYFALKENLENAGQSNAWQNIRNAALDVSDDGLHNGSAGVQFTVNHDVFKPYALDYVAHAYVLMQPGNATVYFNGKEFGDNRDFPKNGSGDALQVVTGSPITQLVEIRNTHGRGNYAERWIDDQGLFAFERVSSAITLLSNRGDSGFDSRTLTQVGFAPGTHLIELTGNAQSNYTDPFNDIPEVVTVFEEGGVNKVNVRFPRNSANGNFHGRGYAIYGLPTPQSNAGLELSNVSQVLAGDTSASNNYEHGTQRQSDVYVINTDSFLARLLTNEVRLLGSDSLRDIYADGDNALFKIDGGLDTNRNGHVDFVTPGSQTYGFEFFGDKSSPLIGTSGIGGPRGDGEFRQTVDATRLSEGYHFLTARAFRHRTDNGPPVFTDFKKSIYVDRLPPVSAVQSFLPFNAGQNENRDLVVRSVDQTAENVHVFLDLPANLTNSQILSMVNGGNQAAKIDRDLFKYGYFSLGNGNHVATVVTYEVTGNVNVQRLAGLNVSSIIGAGLGDVNFDGQYTADDINAFSNVLHSNNSQFNAAADLDGNGVIDFADLTALGDRLDAVNADSSTQAAFDSLAANVFSAVIDSFNIGEDVFLGVLPTGVLGNDRASLPGAQRAVNNPGTFTSTLGAAVTLYADGGFTYDTSNAATLQALVNGQQAHDSFSYTLSDGLGHLVDGTVEITLNGVNDLPTLSALANQNVTAGASVGPLLFTIGDIETALGSLVVSASSSNQAVAPNSGLQLSGNGASRTVSVGTAAGAAGTSTITVSLDDGQSVVQRTFTVTTTVGPTSWRNTAFPEDVNTLNGCTNLDAFILIGDIRANGARRLPDLPLTLGGPPPFLDVSGDGNLTNLDAFLVVGYLRTHPAGEGEASGAWLVDTGRTVSLADMAPPLPGASFKDSSLPSEAPRERPLPLASPPAAKATATGNDEAAAIGETDAPETDDWLTSLAADVAGAWHHEESALYFSLGN